MTEIPVDTLWECLHFRIDSWLQSQFLQQLYEWCPLWSLPCIHLSHQTSLSVGGQIWVQSFDSHSKWNLAQIQLSEVWIESDSTSHRCFSKRPPSSSFLVAFVHCLGSTGSFVRTLYSLTYLELQLLRICKTLRNTYLELTVIWNLYLSNLAIAAFFDVSLWMGSGIWRCHLWTISLS